MQRCLDLAQQGLGQVAPNPMVGAVLVHNDTIVAEGYHEAYGQAHAEVNAIKHLQDQSLLKDCTLYVNLEPCSHHGKTPPCADLIIEKGIRKVMVGNLDSNPLVAGKGIAKLKAAGIEVEYGILDKECRELNKRFFTYHEKKRPYIILKWAQTADGFISKTPLPNNREDNRITGEDSQKLVHLWRNQEQAIMVGTQTVLADNPELTTRLVQGKNPVRVVIDKDLALDQTLAIFNAEAETLVFTEKQKNSSKNIHFITTDFKMPVVPQILNSLYNHNISSVIVEGGTVLLNSFIKDHLWDEARVFVNPTLKFEQGVKAPVMDYIKAVVKSIGSDTLYTLTHS